MITRRNFLKLLGLGALLPFLPKVKPTEANTEGGYLVPLEYYDLIIKTARTQGFIFTNAVIKSPNPPNAKTFSEYVRAIKNDTSASWVGTIYPVQESVNNYYDDGTTSFSVNGYQPEEIARWRMVRAMAEDLDRKFTEGL